MGTDPIIGSVRGVGFNFVERGWLPCDGRLLSIQQYSALFTVIGTSYGGDGRTTFALPDFRSRAIAGVNPSGGANPGGIPIAQGAVTGVETVGLTVAQMPAHTHDLTRKSATDAKDKTNQISPSASLGSIAAVAGDGTITVVPSSDNEVPPNPPLVLNAPFAPQAIGLAGSGTGPENRQPYLAVNFQLCVDGIYPVRP